MYTSSLIRRLLTLIPFEAPDLGQPPFILLGRLLAKVREEHMVVLAPVWETQAWWPLIRWSPNRHCCFQSTQHSGPTKVLSSKQKVKSFFELLFNKKVLHLISSQTNIYAQQRILIKTDPAFLHVKNFHKSLTLFLVIFTFIF